MPTRILAAALALGATATAAQDFSGHGLEAKELLIAGEPLPVHCGTSDKVIRAVDAELNLGGRINALGAIGTETHQWFMYHYEPLFGVIMVSSDGADNVCIVASGIYIDPSFVE